MHTIFMNSEKEKQWGDLCVHLLDPSIYHAY